MTSETVVVNFTNFWRASENLSDEGGLRQGLLQWPEPDRISERVCVKLKMYHSALPYLGNICHSEPSQGHTGAGSRSPHGQGITPRKRVPLLKASSAA